MLNNFFPKVVPFMRQCRETGGVREATDDNAIWRMRFECWIRLHAGTHIHTPMCPDTYTDACTRTHTHTHTHEMCNIYWFSMATIISQTRFSVTLYVHCVFLCFYICASCFISVCFTQTVMNIISDVLNARQDVTLKLFNKPSQKIGYFVCTCCDTGRLCIPYMEYRIFESTCAVHSS